MRVNVVYDEQGAILAAMVVGEGGDEFVVHEGEYTGEFDLQADPEAGLREALADVRVDVASRTLRHG